MNLLPTVELSSTNNLISNVIIEKSSPSLNSNYVNIRFTIALAVPAGKF
jgi:hypothetical protein